MQITSLVLIRVFQIDGFKTPLLGETETVSIKPCGTLQKTPFGACCFFKKGREFPRSAVGNLAMQESS